jgi:sortase A
MRIIGIIMIVCSIGILSFYGYRKISRELYLRKLLNDNINFEIPRLNIKVPVLEGNFDTKLGCIFMPSKCRYFVFFEGIRKRLVG